jgi:hypothetical protein
VFDKAICINLDHRTDRWETSQQEFSSFGIEVERFSGIADNNPMKGIHLSYQKIFQDNYADSLLILEDDVHFIRPYVGLQQAYDDLPKGWDMLYLGGNATRKQARAGTWIYKADGIVTTHAILYSANMVSWLADNMEVPEVVDRTNTIDVWFANTLQKKFNCYIVYPQIAEQRFGYSDICKMDINYKYFNQMAKKFY